MKSVGQSPGHQKVPQISKNRPMSAVVVRSQYNAIETIQNNLDQKARERKTQLKNKRRDLEEAYNINPDINHFSDSEFQQKPVKSRKDKTANP